MYNTIDNDQINKEKKKKKKVYNKTSDLLIK